MSAYRLTEDGQNELEMLRDGLHGLADLVLSHESGSERNMAIASQDLWVLLVCLHRKAATVLSNLRFVPGL